MSNFDDIFSGENQSFFNSGSEFPSFESLDLGAVSNITFDDIQGYRSIREINNEYALNNSPFGKNSLFRSVDYTGKNIDFVKLTDFIKANKDAEFDYRRFIGSTEKQVTHYVSYGYEESKFNRMSNIPNSYTTTEVVDTEVPLLVNKGTPGERALRLKGKLYDEKGVVNIRFDSQQDLTGRIEFQFNLGDSVYYKLHFYYVGEERVLEKENKGSIAFTIYSSSFEDFESMLILCGYYVPDKLYEIVDSAFTKALDKVSKESDVDAEYEDNHAKFRRLDWLYENMPAFVARYLDFNQTIDNVFKLSSWDRRLFLGHDTTQAIVNIISKLNSEQVYKYFYDNPAALINLYGGFDDEDLITQFCQYLTAITFIYGYKSPQDIEKALAKARVFQIGGDAHIETNILYGDEKGKVGLTNELDTFGLVFNTSPHPSASLIAFFYDDIGINKPTDSANKSNQFHPLDLIYIKKTDGVIGADDVNPTIALYGKYLGDKGEWDDIKLAASITADVISIVLSGGAVSLAARIYAIIDVSVSVINIASSFPAVRKELEKTEGGRWFLTNWPIIDLCFSAGTISYYLAKGIIKYSDQLKKVKNNKFVEKIDELAEESRKVVDVNVPPILNAEGFWEYTNRAGTKLKWRNQQLRPKDIENSIKINLASSTNEANKWEAEVANEISKYDEITDFKNDVQNVSTNNRAGDIDIATKKYFIECKSSMNRNSINNTFKEQLLKYLDRNNNKYLNADNKKVVLAINNLQDFKILENTFLKKMQDEYKLIIITDLKQLKNLE